VRGKEEENGERRENAIYPNCRVQMKDSINRFLLLLKGTCKFFYFCRNLENNVIVYYIKQLSLYRSMRQQTTK